MTPGERLYNALNTEMARVSTLNSEMLHAAFPPWSEVHQKTRGVYEEAAAKLDIKPPRLVEGYYWVRGRNPEYPGVFISKWTPDGHGGFWSDSGMSGDCYDVLAGPLEPPK